MIITRCTCDVAICLELARINKCNNCNNFKKTFMLAAVNKRLSTGTASTSTKVKDENVTSNMRVSVAFTLTCTQTLAHLCYVIIQPSSLFSDIDCCASTT